MQFKMAFRQVKRASLDPPPNKERKLGINKFQISE